MTIPAARAQPAPESGRLEAWSGTRRREPAANPRARESVKAVGLAFWQAYLIGDEAARSWLRESADTVVDGERLIRETVVATTMESRD